MNGYSTMDGWYANQRMRSNYNSHLIDYYAYLEEQIDEQKTTENSG